eukprot:365187-Chlamydomonas_euryale.AAC.23
MSATGSTGISHDGIAGCNTEVETSRTRLRGHGKRSSEDASPRVPDPWQVADAYHRCQAEVLASATHGAQQPAEIMDPIGENGDVLMVDNGQDAAVCTTSHPQLDPAPVEVTTFVQSASRQDAQAALAILFW